MNDRNFCVRPSLRRSVAPDISRERPGPDSYLFKAQQAQDGSPKMVPLNVVH